MTMTPSASPTTKISPDPVVIVRNFSAPRPLVFQAWSSAEHLKRWFCPETYTVSEAQVDFRPGGVCAICMRSPEGQEHWSRGEYTEISPPDRLAFVSSVEMEGALAFTAHTTVTFEADGPGTRMTVRQDYDIHNEAALFAIDGAHEGWRTTLDQLAREVARIELEKRERPVEHGTFRIERDFDAAPARVFHALTDKAAKARWFPGVDNQTELEREMDVRPGGRERLVCRWASGLVTAFDAVYLDVVADRRLVYAYDLHHNERKLSVSLATMEIGPRGAGTRLIVTEQGAFLDGYDDAGSREHGTRLLMDRLGASLAD